ncbi:alpha/beta fold hydrolase [Nocardiopsis mangrovi]|uniref:Alpha/beta fold hydrolase n=1 Tax=Nocardiopsis mangrovi TaxID=1179818 RepID=A0ABV9DXW9_9ACTN
MTVAERRRMRVVSADGTRLHVDVQGDDSAPTLVLAHGWACAVPFWTPMVTRLGPGLRVVRYDQRGHGRSDAPPRGGYGTDALADDLCAVLEATVPDGARAVLAGHSMGAMALMAAAGRPVFRARAAAVALISTGSAGLLGGCRVVPGVGRHPRVNALAHRVALGSALPLGPVTSLTSAALRYATMAPGAAADVARLCALLVHACPPVPRRRWARVLAGLDLDDAVGALDVPAAVVAGTLDRLTPIAHAHRMTALLPGPARYVEIPGAGHMTPLEAPSIVAAVLRDLADAHLAAAPAEVGGDRGRTAL